MDSHVEFLGNLPQVDIRNLLNKAKLLIHTAQYETFGLVAIEANSMGVPVLTTNNGSMQEIIINEENGFLVDKNDSQKMYERIELLLNKKNVYEKIVNNGYEKICNQFGVEKMVQKYEDLLN